MPQRNNVTARDLDNKPRPLAGFSIVQVVGLVVGFLLAAAVWSLLPPLRDIAARGRTVFLLHIMLSAGVFAVIAFVVIVADADNVEPFARHYWNYARRPHRYVPAVAITTPDRGLPHAVQTGAMSRGRGVDRGLVALVALAISALLLRLLISPAHPPARPHIPTQTPRRVPHVSTQRPGGDRTGRGRGRGIAFSYTTTPAARYRRGYAFAAGAASARGGRATGSRHLRGWRVSGARRATTARARYRAAHNGVLR